MEYLRVKNWESHQHYKDRSPPWIKLHRELLTDYEFGKLPDASKGQLMMVWILASQMDGKIPNDAKWIAQRIGATSPVNLDALIGGGWLLEDEGTEPKKEKWPSRYVSAELRAQVLERDGHKCVACSSETDLEIDHKTPVSKGGLSEFDNLQVLCRSCNRSKRTKSAEQHATQIRSLEAEERQRQRQTRIAAGPTDSHKKLAASLGIACSTEWDIFWGRVESKGSPWFKEPSGVDAAFSNWLRQERKYADRDGRLQTKPNGPLKVAL